MRLRFIMNLKIGNQQGAPNGEFFHLHPESKRVLVVYYRIKILPNKEEILCGGYSWIQDAPKVHLRNFPECFMITK
jgi:hypothetical protein